MIIKPRTSALGAFAMLMPLLVGFLGSCAVGPAAPTVPGSRLMVRGSGSQFYKYGPAQAFGADATLPKGKKMTLIKSSFGFSEVRLDDGMTGFVATDELQAAPADPVVRPAVVAVASRRRASAPPPEPEGQLDLSDVPAPLLPTNEEPVAKPSPGHAH